MNGCIVGLLHWEQCAIANKQHNAQKELPQISFSTEMQRTSANRSLFSHTANQLELAFFLSNMASVSGRPSNIHSMTAIKHALVLIAVILGCWVEVGHCGGGFYFPPPPPPPPPPT